MRVFLMYMLLECIRSKSRMKRQRREKNKERRHFCSFIICKSHMNYLKLYITKCQIETQLHHLMPDCNKQIHDTMHNRKLCSSTYTVEVKDEQFFQYLNHFS